MGTALEAGLPSGLAALGAGGYLAYQQFLADSGVAEPTLRDQRGKTLFRNNDVDFDALQREGREISGLDMEKVQAHAREQLKTRRMNSSTMGEVQQAQAAERQLMAQTSRGGALDYMLTDPMTEGITTRGEVPSMRFGSAGEIPIFEV